MPVQSTTAKNSLRWTTLQLLAIVATSGLLTFFGARALFRDVAFHPSSAKSDIAGNSTGLAHTSRNNQSVDSISGHARTDFPAQWTQLCAQANTPQRDRQLAALIEELARTDHSRAFSLVDAESNWRLREELRDAALRGWASADPDAAGDWALQTRTEDRVQAVSAVLAGAAAHPESAVKLALRLCAADPESAGDFGHAAVAALSENGNFESAARFGQSAGMEKYPFLLRSAFFQWARNQPNSALAAAQRIENPTTREQVVAETLAGWAWADAKALAEYARTLPASAIREKAFAEALPQWVERDPDAATAWINKQDAGPEFDAGIETVANLQSIITAHPDTAMALAGSISDPARRSHALRAVFRQWATNNPDAARAYVNKAGGTADYALLMDELKDMSPN
ncbi:MAG: hypothetical protein QM715_05870 [Nibricoccus sp.]